MPTTSHETELSSLYKRIDSFSFINFSCKDIGIIVIIQINYYFLAELPLNVMIPPQERPPMTKTFYDLASSEARIGSEIW